MLVTHSDPTASLHEAQSAFDMFFVIQCRHGAIQSFDVSVRFSSLFGFFFVCYGPVARPFRHVTVPSTLLDLPKAHVRSCERPNADEAKRVQLCA